VSDLRRGAAPSMGGSNCRVFKQVKNGTIGPLEGQF
jgi:hypothetical protein